MAGSCALYCSANFIVVTRLRAAVMVSGEGVCARETEIGNRNRHAMIKRRLAMVSSDAPSCDGHLKTGIPRKGPDAQRLLSRGPVSGSCLREPFLSRQERINPKGTRPTRLAR